MSTRIEDMKMQIDNYYTAGGNMKSKSKNVSYQNLMDAKNEGKK